MIEYQLSLSETDATDHKTDMERYRSGHNEAVLKTVCPQGRVGSNPTLSVFISAIWRSTQAGRRGSPGKGVGR